MRLDRLLGIILYLLDEGQASAAELAEHFGTSERTIYRDMESLSLAGVPLVALPGSGGGYQLAARYTLKKGFLSPAELRSLIAVLDPIGRAANDEGLKLALGKLKAMSARDDLDSPPAIAVSPFPWGGVENDSCDFKSIRRAIDERRLLRIDYAGVRAQRESRVVEPFTLALGGQAWYLHAFCRLRSDFRLFRLSRIESLELLVDGFDPRGRIPVPSPWGHSWGGPLTEIIIRVGKESRLQVLDCFLRRQVTELPSGGFEIRFRWPERDDPLRYLMGLGPDLQIVSPPALKARVARVAEALCQANREP
jgi:predicted DNA-binding transcriptional regulator YafY